MVKVIWIHQERQQGWKKGKQLIGSKAKKEERTRELINRGSKARKIGY
jgi:hypothetical protein